VLAGLGTGAHSVYVRGQDAAGNWGAVTAATISFDRTGPTTAALVAKPAASNGTVSVAVQGTASDAGAGNSNVIAAEYWIDGGAPVAIAITVPAATVSIDATISAATVNALADGNHTLSVRSQDAASNWGSTATFTMKVDKTGPATSAQVANPNPNNGTLPFSPSIPAVRVTATVADLGSNVVAAEAFIGPVGANGTGALFVPVDGNWNSLSENVRLDIPLTTITLLANGPHTISVHGKDAAGNWGGMATVVLNIDRTNPAVGAATVTPGVNAVTVATTATDALGVARVEYYIDTDPGRGFGVALVAGVAPNWSVVASTFALAEGSHTVYVRARDNAGNWSTISSAAFTVNRTLYFSTAGSSNPPGVAGTADDSDIYQANGATFSRQVDLSTLGVPTSANVDGLKRVSNTDFYVSFADNTTITGFGTVQDEDIVRYNAGVWSVYFDGTAPGLNTAARDIDAFDIVGSTIYFSTTGNSNPPGVVGTSDDSDIYSWNGSVFARVWDATANGVPGGANVDGVAYIDATHVLVTFADNTTITGPGAFQDEDIVYFNGGTWMMWYDATAKGLSTANLDMDEIDVP
ncbi:MAG: Ig-like domain-containing protein, partial [Actinomycetota bacterium]|nr:Ig-like domain-containing protein [Actinomycetota bacterium]